MNSTHLPELIRKTATVLVKFQKIKNHTDPSMVSKKKLFTQKYKDLLEEMIAILRREDSYSSLSALLAGYSESNPLKLSGSNLDAVCSKIRRDLDKHFVETPVLPELIPDQKKDYKKKYLRREVPVEPPPHQEKHYTKKDLMELVRITKRKRETAKKQKQAVVDLQLYLEKIRQLDPETVSKKISQIIQAKKRTP